MSIFDENKFTEITPDDIHDATYSSSNMDERLEQRAFANVLGGRLGVKYLKSIGFNATNENSLYTIPAVLKDMDIADISVGNIKVDIRIVPNAETLFVPKSQFEFNVTPDIYIFLLLEPDLSSAHFIGAISPEEINKSKEKDGYYLVSPETLYNENSLKKALKSNKPQSNLPINENDTLKAEALMVNFIDGDILNNEKHFVYEQLTKSNKLCEMFRDFQHFELISTDLAHTDEILNDSVLDVLGAQQLYNNDDSDNFGTDIDLDKLANETVADFVEDYIENQEEENNMDFNNNNNIINGEFEEKGEEVIEEAGQLESLPSDEELANFETFEPETISQEEELSLDDIANENNVIENINQDLSNAFEGFSGLEPNLSTEDLEDLTNNTVNLDDLDFSNHNELQNKNELNSTDNSTSTFDLEELDFSKLDEIVDSSNEQAIASNEAQNVEESTAQFETLEDLDPEEETDNTPLETYSEDAEVGSNDIKEETPLLTDLDAFETPIDLTLPELEPDDDLPMLEEISDEAPENTQDADITPIDENNDSTTITGDFTPLEEIEPLEELQPIDDNIQPVEEDFNSQEEEVTPQQDITNELVADSNVQESSDNVEAPADNNTNLDENDDISGFEEFTMDMAAAVEEANPNLNNPQIPNDNVNDAMNDAFSAFSDFTSNSTSEQQEQENQLTNSEFNNINLDDLDADLDDDTTMDGKSSQSDINSDDLDMNSEIDNLINGDFNLDDINLDDIDLNDPSIQNVDLDLADEDLNAYQEQPAQSVDINNIPADTDPQVAYNQQQEGYYNQDMNMQMNNQQMNTNDYNPNFASNDQNTIETLYDNNQVGQIGNDAMDNSLNQNNINMNTNYQQPQQKQKKKSSSSPLLGILLLVLLGAFGYMKKDLIMEKFNENTNFKTEQDQNMPIEGESLSDKRTAKMFKDDTEMDDTDKKPIGKIPGEAGGPQDIASMNKSLSQGKAKLTDKDVSTLPSAAQAPLYTNQIKKLYWEVPQELTYNDSIVKYLKITGKNIKFSAQSDLLSASELPYSSKMIINIQIDKSGEIGDITTSVSSGSKQIDQIVLQNVKAALKYVKAPTSEFTKESYNFSLIINF